MMESINYKGPGGSMSWVIELPNNSYKPITNMAWVRARLCKLQKGCFRLPAANDKVYQLLTQGRWFSPRVLRLLPPLKLVAMILLKVALKHQKSIYQSINYMCIHNLSWKVLKCVGAWIAQWVRSLDLTAHTSLSLIWRGFAPGFVYYSCKW